MLEFLKIRESLCNAFPIYRFNTLGGIDFLLKCNFSDEKFLLIGQFSQTSPASMEIGV